MPSLLTRLTIAGPVALTTALALLGALRAMPLTGHWQLLFAACVAGNVAVVAAVAWGGLLNLLRPGQASHASAARRSPVTTAPAGAAWAKAAPCPAQSCIRAASPAD